MPRKGTGWMDIYVRITVRKGIVRYDVATGQQHLYARRCETLEERRESVREIDTLLAHEVKK